MQFAQPIFLWALAGLSVPIAIHLLSRKEGKVIRLGSLRHLQETSTQQFKGIKLNEIVLLALRSLLIILFVLLICGIFWRSDKAKRWLVVENSLDKNPLAKKVIDSLTKQGFEQHLLQKGFPTELEQPTEKINYWELISSLDQLDLQQAIVLSNSKAEDFDGPRKSLSTSIQWITFPADSSDFIAEAVQQTPQRVLVRRGHSTAAHTNFKTEYSSKPLSDSIKIEKLDTISVSIISDPDFKLDKQIINACLMAVENSLPIKINMREATQVKTNIPSTDVLIWLSEAPVPIIDSFKIISYSKRPSNQLIEQVAPNRWDITKRLNLDIALQENLSLKLATFLTNEKEKWNRIAHQDRRTLPDSILVAGAQTDSVKGDATFIPPINKYILLFLLSILIIERIVAYQLNQ